MILKAYTKLQNAEGGTLLQRKRTDWPDNKNTPQEVAHGVPVDFLLWL